MSIWVRGGSEWRNEVFDVCRQNSADEDRQIIFITHEREQESQFLSCPSRMRVKSLVTCWTVGRPLWWEEGESKRVGVQGRSAVVLEPGRRAFRSVSGPFLSLSKTVVLQQ